MRSRTYAILFFALLAPVTLAAVFCLYSRTPPAIARLLPECDAIAFLDVATIRAATHFDRHPPNPSLDLKQFIDATGIVPERDLDQVAFAMNRMPNPSGPNGPVAFSEVLAGQFDTPRLTRYLSAQASSQQLYAHLTIYSIPSSQGYTDRVVLLDKRTLAASNAPTPEQLHAMIDRFHQTFTLYSASSLLAARYSDIPAFSPAWAVGQLGLPFAENGKLTLAGLELPVPADSTFIASLRFSEALHLRVDQLTDTEATAARTAQSLSNLLALFRRLQPPLGGNPTLLHFLDSISIEPHSDRATLTATIPTNLLSNVSRP